MARMYSRRKGKSGSTRPNRTEVPSGVEIDAEELEGHIVKLWKADKSSSGIITAYLMQNWSQTKRSGTTVWHQISEGMRNLIVKALRLRTHLGTKRTFITNVRCN